MKKLLWVVLAVIALAAGLFFCRGGHHALHMAAVLEEWADADAADHRLCIEANGVSIEGDFFWIERNDERVWCFESDGCGIYLRDGVLCTDTGKSYSLPDLEPDEEGLLRKLLLGAVVTKEDGTYHFRLDQEQLSLDVQLHETELLTVDADFLYDGQSVTLRATLRRQQLQQHTLPREVLDAMVRAEMEPPMSILEPLETLIPALSGLDPFHAQAELNVTCGILNLSEQMSLSASSGNLRIERQGITVDLPLPETLSQIQPLQAGLLLLRNGTFETSGSGALLRIQIPAEDTASLIESMVPQIADLGVSYQDAAVEIHITGKKADQIRMTVSGSVPFLITEIPIEILLTCTIT